MPDIKTGKVNVNEELGSEYVFAMDIGTRSVIGIVGRQEGAFFNVIDAEMLEHPTRAMMDGQIEDIEKVAHIASLVKERLEQRLKIKLKRVCVAAAGRSLKTSKADFQVEFAAAENITENAVYELEMGAVAAARDKVNAENEAAQFYCVGHAVIRYFLDDYPFANILNHRGKVAKVEVIATFLPNEVVDSLCTTMAMVGLEISHLTLEPIAAMNAVIPQELRLLNLALVDIGAGTSDIATSDSGGVSAYTMATVAGDEVTEEIIRRCLVDFATAERIKHEAAKGEPEISYRDILGFDYSIELADVLEMLKPAVKTLADTICERILEVNGKAPMAVFLVGGGSRVPLLCDIVADTLNIDHKKVAVGGNNFIGRVVHSELDLAGPEYATPIGIAMTGATAGMRESFYVFVNNKKTRIFRNYNVTVMDVLLTSGYQYSQLMGKGGKSLSYTLNGNKTILRGGMYQPAAITVNGVQSGISTKVECGDEIMLLPATPGRDAYLRVSDIAQHPLDKINVELDGVLMEAGCYVTVNGRAAVDDKMIEEQDDVECFSVRTLEELCKQAELSFREHIFYVNGEAQGAQYLLKDGDIILTEEHKLLHEANSGGEEEKHEVQEQANVETRAEEVPQVEMQKPIKVSLNGSVVELPPKEVGLDYQFIDMLTVVDIDPSKPQGNIVLRLNGENASYLQAIKEGDRIEIFWDGAEINSSIKSSGYYKI